MKTIYKYPFKITDEQTLELPEYCELNLVGLDPLGQPCIWLEVNDEQLITQPVTLFVVGTGNPIPDDAKNHLGSFVLRAYVWHIYSNEIF